MPRLWELGWLAVPCACRVLWRPSPPGILPTPEMWQVSGRFPKPERPREASKPSLKIPGFRVVTFPWDLRGLHQQYLQRMACQSHLGGPGIFGFCQSWGLLAGGMKAELLLSTSDSSKDKSSEDESLARKLLPAGTEAQRPCREQSIWKQRNYPRGFF